MARTTARLAAHERIRGWRKSKGLTLVQLSERTGFWISALSRLENGTQPARAEHFEAIAQALGLTMAEFYDDAALRRAARPSRAGRRGVVST